MNSDPDQRTPAPAGSQGPLARLTDPSRAGMLLPATGMWIFGLDWLLFSSNAASLGLATPISVGLGFVLGGLGTLMFQRRFARDPWWKAALKGLIGGIVVGAPWPVGGTVIGGWVLFASGLRGIASKQDP